MLSKIIFFTLLFCLKYAKIICMETKENIHAGHRQRMLKKLSKNADLLAEHELLEIILYRYIPRKDTNKIAHKLLASFGSIADVFNAEPKQLTLVDGIGFTTAVELSALGKIFNNIKQKDKQYKNWYSFESRKNEVIKYFQEIKEEKILFIFLNGKNNEISRLEFESNFSSMVETDVSSLANALAFHKPKTIIAIHNHPSGNVEPSEQDDETTQKINLLCEIHGVVFKDHIIVANDKTFSYYLDGRMHYIRETTKFKNIVNKIKEI